MMSVPLLLLYMCTGLLKEPTVLSPLFVEDFVSSFPSSSPLIKVEAISPVFSESSSVVVLTSAPEVFEFSVLILVVVVVVGVVVVVFSDELCASFLLVVVVG